MSSALEAMITLPFEPEFIDEGNDCYNNVESCVLYRMLPANAKDYVRASPTSSSTSTSCRSTPSAYRSSSRS